MQASLLLFWLRFPEPAGGALAKAFMGTQAAVFILELLWRRRGLRDPASSRYARWREALVALLRLNEGLLGSLCLASSGRRWRRWPWIAAGAWWQPGSRQGPRQPMPPQCTAGILRAAADLDPHPPCDLLPAVAEGVAGNGGPRWRRHWHI